MGFAINYMFKKCYEMQIQKPEIVFLKQSGHDYKKFQTVRPLHFSDNIMNETNPLFMIFLISSCPIAIAEHSFTFHVF